MIRRGGSRLFRLLAAVIVNSGAASAHAISMSSGFATVNGNRVEYILRMPEYEIAPTKDRARALLDHIRFTSGFETGRRVDTECHDDPGGSTYLCAANYAFSRPVERLGVECTFYEVTVPNHLHMLRADREGKHDQAILDSAFPSATLAFRPATMLEMAVEQSASGAMRVWTNLAQVLLLAAIALASRTWREFALAVAAFLVGECGGTAILLRTMWQPPLRFAEAAAALALAYLSLEILAFPSSSGRWLLAFLFGAFQSMFFALFVADSDYGAVWVLSGATFAALVVAGCCALLGFLAMRAMTKVSYRSTLRKAGACMLGLTGIIWFTLRVRS